MSQIDSEPTNGGTRKLTVTELQSLADRLLSRGVSRLFSDQPELQRDLKAAATALRELACARRHLQSLFEIERAAARLQAPATVDLGVLAARLTDHARAIMNQSRQEMADDLAAASHVAMELASLRSELTRVAARTESAGR
ncbi:MAG TPA: hypothetical protein VKT99_22295 [Xanthobacteraceae bacterium]|jgi:hypothetical protein|nr:hypothetical protein [Xanthobacteraceae bacterium]